MGTLPVGGGDEYDFGVSADKKSPKESHSSLMRRLKGDYWKEDEGKESKKEKSVAVVSVNSTDPVVDLF